MIETIVTFIPFLIVGFFSQYAWSIRKKLRMEQQYTSVLENENRSVKRERDCFRDEVRHLREVQLKGTESFTVRFDERKGWYSYTKI